MSIRKKLILARHATAEPCLPNLHDADRHLTTQGVMQAQELGLYLDRWGVTVDAIIASDAQRVQQTVDAMLQTSEHRHAQPDFRPALYNASASGLDQVVRACPDTVTTLLIVSHNPGIGALAAQLSAPQAKPKSYAEATMAIFDVACPWDMITPHYAIMEDLVTPNAQGLTIVDGTPSQQVSDMMKAV